MDAILGSIPKAKFMYNGNGNVNGNYLNIGNANNQNKYFSVNSSYANNSFNQD